MSHYTICKRVFALLSVFIICLLSYSQPGVNDAGKMIDQLKRTQGAASRMNLIMQFSEYKKATFTASQLKTVSSTLLHWYRTDPDAGVHSAISYLFRNHLSDSSDGGRQFLEELEKIDKEFVGKISASRRWYNTSQGNTMTVIHGPVKFVMGSPEQEKGRDSDEVRHEVYIPRSFAISTTEVTVEQFQQFIDENPGIIKLAKSDSTKDPSRHNSKLLHFSPKGKSPQILMTWYEAAQYCNWLSSKEGIPESEWCYPPLDNIKSGMILYNDYLQRTGYRMLTEAEWEYACRAGSDSSRYYGSSEEILSQYAWYSRNPPRKKGDANDPNDPQHTYPVGILKPNAFGLFDMYGNVWEWCTSKRLPYIPGRSEDIILGNLLVTDSTAMIRRGGSFAYDKYVMRSAHRGAIGYFPMQRRDNVGFRICRTIKK